MKRVGIKRAYKNLFRKKNRNASAGFFAVGLLLGAAYLYTPTMLPKVDPQAYTPLLNTIAEGESKGNYNAYYGNVANSEIRFTEMTLDEVVRWQTEFVDSGQPSSAVGKYQIIRPTLEGLIKEMKLSRDEIYDEELQDKMAIALLERRGSREYVHGSLSRDEFAANLAKEWAALPRITGQNSHESYYAGDGLNVAHISKESVFSALHMLKG